MNERYYYSIMTPDERRAYKMIFNGLKMRAFNIVVSVYISLDQVQDVYLKVLYDNPLFYYINQTIIKTQGQPGHWILLPEYLLTKTEINKININIRKVINSVKARADAFRNNKFRLEKCLHDSVVKSVAYDYDSIKKKDSFHAYSIVGAFLDRRAVCEGIAKAFKLLCNEFGMKCIVVLGKADKKGVFTEDSYHAWNLVKVDNESYYVDVTWDNLYDKDFHHISYDYFNLTTKEILLDHQPTGDLPICDATRLNYFYSTRSFISAYEDLIELINQRFAAKEITFKARKDKGQFLCPDELREKTLAAMMHVMSERGCAKQYALLFNEMHNIGKIIFMPEDGKKTNLTKTVY